MSVITAIILALQTLFGLNSDNATSKAKDIYTSGQFKVDEKGNLVSVAGTDVGTALSGGIIITDDLEW